MIPVSTVTRIQAGRCEVRFSNGTKYIYHLQNLPTESKAHPISYRVRTVCSFPRRNRSGVEIDHSPSSSAEIKNEWSYASTSPVCLHSVHRDKFTLIA
jgi:hypothetical protein